jgi:outer membrane protein TolC
MIPGQRSWGEGWAWGEGWTVHAARLLLACGLGAVAVQPASAQAPLGAANQPRKVQRPRAVSPSPDKQSPPTVLRTGVDIPIPEDLPDPHPAIVIRPGGTQVEAPESRPAATPMRLRVADASPAEVLATQDRDPGKPTSSVKVPWPVDALPPVPSLLSGSDSEQTAPPTRIARGLGPKNAPSDSVGVPPELPTTTSRRADEVEAASVGGDSTSTSISSNIGPTAPDLAPFWHRTLVERDEDVVASSPGNLIPKDFTPWWQDLAGKRYRERSERFETNIDLLVISALQHSPYVVSVSTDPLMRQTMITEEWAEFDWRAFVESKYDDLSDPVGNLLTTGGSPRFRDNHWRGSAGVKRKTSAGGEFRAQQRLGFQDNNSVFFVPSQQGTARFELSYTQPLLNGAGECYNQSRIVLASIDTDIVTEETQRQLQDHLFRVTQTYWELYRARSQFLQKQKLLDSASTILETIEARREIDALQRQVLRGQSAVTSRRSAMARAETEIRNAESRLRLLVNDPRMLETTALEYLPLEAPLSAYVDLSVTPSLQTALENRPDIHQAIHRVKATGVRLGVSRQDILPKLDLILSTYVAGLSGDSQIGQAYGQQFYVGEPGYTVGMLFEVPLGNRAAKAQYERRELEMRKALADFRSSVETGLTEVELALREARTSYLELGSRFQAMLAAERESLYLLERWKLMPDDDRSSILLLEDLLDSQERLANEEADFTNAQVGYVLALAQLKRAQGILLKTLPAAGPGEVAELDGALPPQEVAPESEPAVTPPPGLKAPGLEAPGLDVPAPATSARPKASSQSVVPVAGVRPLGGRATSSTAASPTRQKTTAVRSGRSGGP